MVNNNNKKGNCYQCGLPHYICSCSSDEIKTRRKIAKYSKPLFLYESDIMSGLTDCKSKIIQFTDDCNCNTCIACGKTCNNIGELNRIGLKKAYCCECFAKIDNDFISSYWCETCSNRLADPFYEARRYQSDKMVQKVENIFKR